MMNNTFSDIVELLHIRANQEPLGIAYTFLLMDKEDEFKPVNVTYQQLEQQAQAIAVNLKSILKPGQRTLMFYPAGLEFISAFFGCLYAGVVAIPAYPPRKNHHFSRLEAIVSDSQAQVILTTNSVLSKFKNVETKSQILGQINWIATNDIPLSKASEWIPPQINSETLAFLQYTSGSTGLPKGVMVTHKNLLRNSLDLDLGLEHDENSTIVTWLPTFHDMGLIYGVIQPLYKGCSCYMMAPETFLQKPIRWLKAISQYKGTHSVAPNFGYETCVRRIKAEEIAQLDLSTWRMALNGAEPVRADVLEQFVEKFQSCGFDRRVFSPGYGLAEATLKVSTVNAREIPRYLSIDNEHLKQHRVVKVSADDPKAKIFVSCGWTDIDTNIVIVNPETFIQCGSGEVGEIWVSGTTIPLGYWNKPVATQETFQAYLADTKEGPFMRTGDLGFVDNGELFITGRIKDVIIIRGRNYYPQDIESAVEKSHPALRPTCCAAFTVEIAGEERLIVVQEVKRTHLRKLNATEVITAIRRTVSQEQDLQLYSVVLLKTATIPKTSSGKIQRRTCRAKFLDNSLDIIDSWQLELELKPSAKPLNREEILHNNNLSHLNNIKPSLKTSSLIANSPKNSSSRADRIIEWLREYGKNRINSRLIDERRCIPPYIVLDFGNQGLLGMQVPEAYGGMDLTYRDTFRVFEQLAAIDLTLASFVAVHHVLGVRPIINHAPEHVCHEILPLLAQGRELAGFAITEPMAGSNPRGMMTQAIPDMSGGWRLDGQKSWIGHGSWAGVVNVFAKTLDEHNQPTGISGFTIRQGTPGFRPGGEAMTMGMRGMVQNTIHLNNVLVTSENLLGTVNNGMQVAQDAMMHARLIIGVMSLGGMKRCAQLMIQFSSRRSIATGRLLDNPVSLVWLNDLTAAITSLETLIMQVADLLDQNRFIPQEAFSVCKIAGSELCSQAADRLMQMLGGRGYIETNQIPQILRDSRLFRIFEGPTETLNMFLGSRAMNQNLELQRFLNEDLGTPEITLNLMAAIDQIKSHFDAIQLSFPTRQSAQNWAYICTGELVSLAMLWAAVRGASSRTQSFELQCAETWAKSKFTQKLDLILAQTPSEMVLLNAESLTNCISEYITTIGDVEQTLAGEDHNIDQFLKSQHQTEIIENQAPSIATVLEKKTHKSKLNAQEIENWIKQWLTERLKITINSVDSNISFADYGIDSVLAMELTQDLEDWLKFSLDYTILWNFPTIQSLSEHLTLMANPPESQSALKDSMSVSTEDTKQTASVEKIKSDIDRELEQIEQLLKLKV